MHRFNSIQYLRAVAALMVVYHHAAGRAGAPTWGGAAGVDLFFVISGFIMWVVSTTRETEPWTFFGNRVVRVVPLYWFYTTVFLLLAVAVPAAFPRFVIEWPHVVASYLFDPWYSPQGELQPVLVQGWTLNLEMFFYFIFALALLLAPQARLVAIWGIFVLLVIFGRFYQGNNAAILAYSDPIVLEFAVGMSFGWIYSSKLRLSLLASCAIIAAGILILAGSSLVGVSSPRIVVWGVPAALLVFGAIYAERAYPNSSRIGLLLGDSSYSTYLVHTFVVSALAKIVSPNVAPAVFIAVAMVLSAAAGYASFRLIEKPLLARGKQSLTSLMALMQRKDGSKFLKDDRR